MRAIRGADAQLAFPDECLTVVGDLGIDAVVQHRDGLPRLAAALGGALHGEPLRVCYLGGSVTEQRTGYRPRVTRWLELQGKHAGVKIEEVPAFCGSAQRASFERSAAPPFVTCACRQPHVVCTLARSADCGSKVLAFMVADWVVARRPHLVFIELAINDGDTLLETEDGESIGSALEGIVRHVRDALPRCELCLLHMFIRDDLPLRLRTGSKAWAENEDADAASYYDVRVPRLHNKVAAHYGIPAIAMGPIMKRLPPRLRDRFFRDDCHFLDPGAAFAAAAICAALEAILQPQVARLLTPSNGIATLPPPLHARPWGRGRAEAVIPQQLSFFYPKNPPTDPAAIRQFQQQLMQRHTQMDMDPLNNVDAATGAPTQRAWWLLYAGDAAEIKFTGTRLGILTMVGPDAGIVTCEVDGGAKRCQVNLLDKWAYFFRLAVVELLDDLPPGPHHAVLRFEEERPDRRVLKKAPSGPHWAAFEREGKDHKLWLMHWLIEEESELERAMVPGARASEPPAAVLPGGARLGGAGMASGGRRADAY